MMKILTLADQLKNILTTHQGDQYQIRLQYIAHGEPHSIEVDLLDVRNGGVILRSNEPIVEGKAVLLLVSDIDGRQQEEMPQKRQVKSIESKMLISRIATDESRAGKYVLSADFVGNYRIKGGEAK